MSERVTARIVIGTWLALFIMSSTSAEAMDKEPTLRGVWTAAAVLGTAGAVAWVWNRWLGLGMSVLVLFYAWATHMELSDPFVGRAIVAEAGPIYVRQSYAVEGKPCTHDF